MKAINSISKSSGTNGENGSSNGKSNEANKTNGNGISATLSDNLNSVLDDNKKDNSDKSLQLLSDLVCYMKYARYLPEENRRETWREIVDRNKNMHIKKFPFLKDQIEAAYKYVYDKKLLPSARSLHFNGKAVELNNVRIYNCSFVAIDHWKVFSEILFVLLSGTGVGISVQNHHVRQLPPIKHPNKNIKKRFLIGDSIEGWADAIKVLMKSYFFGGPEIKFDYRNIRPKGARLKTSGGVAPGPDGLRFAINKIKIILDKIKVNEQLSPIQVHDLICHLADCVLSGGIRRSSLISLFSMSNREMIRAKTGEWWKNNPQRGRANNSAVVLRHRITKNSFDRLWKQIQNSKSGEPGIFFSNDKSHYGLNPCCNASSKLKTPIGYETIRNIKIGDKIWDGEQYVKVLNKWFNGIKMVYKYTTKFGSIELTKNHPIISKGEKVKIGEAKGIDDKDGNFLPFLEIQKIGFEPVYDINVDNEKHIFLCNGHYIKNCAEISLKSFTYCNLTEINANTVKEQYDFNNRAKAAALIGTLQASYTNFHYLRPIWKEKTEKDALIGVGITGIANKSFLKLDLKEAANIVMKENERVAKLIKINKAARLNCVKPSGTLSLLAKCSSGIHAWYAPYYIRRIRVNKEEAIYKYLKWKIPRLITDDVFKPDIQAVISIPIKSPDNAILNTEETAINLLERVKRFNEEWIYSAHRRGDNKNNSSVTCYIKDDEWDEVGEWMWNNRESYNAISVLPYDGGTYQQMPFEEITKEKYEELLLCMNDLDLSEIKEDGDYTSHRQESACSGGSCEVTFL